MAAIIYQYPILIKETYLDDVYGHVNDSTYMVLFEEARWDFITKNGYDFKKIQETGLGPVVLEARIRYQKELCLREEIIIETQTTSYKKKIGKMLQRMLKGNELCCIGEFTFGLFDLKERKLIVPTPEWLKAIGLASS